MNAKNTLAVVALLVQGAHDHQARPRRHILHDPLAQLLPRVHEEQVRDGLTVRPQEGSVHLEAEFRLHLAGGLLSQRWLTGREPRKGHEIKVRHNTTPLTLTPRPGSGLNATPRPTLLAAEDSHGRWPRPTGVVL